MGLSKLPGLVRPWIGHGSDPHDRTGKHMGNQDHMHDVARLHSAKAPAARAFVPMSAVRPSPEKTFRSARATVPLKRWVRGRPRGQVVFFSQILRAVRM